MSFKFGLPLRGVILAKVCCLSAFLCVSSAGIEGSHMEYDHWILAKQLHTLSLSRQTSSKCGGTTEDYVDAGTPTDGGVWIVDSGYRELVGRGAHRKLNTKLNLAKWQCGSQKEKPTLTSQTMRIALLEHLSAGVFADSFELQQTRGHVAVSVFACSGNNGCQLSHFERSYVDIEVTEPEAGPSVLLYTTVVNASTIEVRTPTEGNGAKDRVECCKHKGRVNIPHACCSLHSSDSGSPEGFEITGYEDTTISGTAHAMEGSPCSSGAHLWQAEMTLSVPLHARYPAALKADQLEEKALQALVQLGPPDVFLLLLSTCVGEAKPSGLEMWQFVCWRDFRGKLKLDWAIPAGNSEHIHLVTWVTALAAVLGAAIIITAIPGGHLHDQHM